MHATGSTSSTFDFSSYASVRRQLVEDRLGQYLTVKEPTKLWEAMRYSVLSGGKRLRALLCIAAAEAVATREKLSAAKVSDKSNALNATQYDHALLEAVLPLCCAIEMVHAMSLIHDDLPVMDNDDWRRGKPTNHKVFGEATALLAGDALLVFANEILVSKTPESVKADVLLSVVADLAKAVGPQGMVGGQIYDLAFTGSAKEESNKNVYASDIVAIETIHKYKTAALIRFSAWAGARLAGADQKQLQLVDEFAAILGLAFQIADDLLDCVGDIRSLGKTPGKDQAALKATWVTYFGVDGTRAKLTQLEQDGLTLLDNSHLDHSCQPALRALLKYAIHRSN
jgi:geranylgeranyl diphosphate synthase type II